MPGARDFRLMTRQMVDAILSMKEYNRYTKGMFGFVGFETKWIEYSARERAAGTSKFSLIKLIKYALEGIVAFSTVPLKISTFIGFVSSILSVLYLIFVVVQKLAFGIDVPSYATIIVLLLLIGGLILFSLGIIGEYLARMYVQLKNRPIYIEKTHLESNNEHN